MKLLGLIAILAFSTQSFAATTLLTCKVTEVLDSSVFEESLSVEEYPNVTVTSDEMSGLEIGIGSSLFNLDNYNEITLEPSVGLDKTYKITNYQSDEVFYVKYNGTSKQGSVSIESSNKNAVVAVMECK